MSQRSIFAFLGRELFLPAVVSVRFKSHCKAIFTENREVKKKRVSGLLGTFMSNRNVQCLNAVLLLTEKRNKVHPLAEDEWA